MEIYISSLVQAFPNIEGIDGNEGAHESDIPKIYNEYMDEGREVAQMNQYLDTLQHCLEIQFGFTIWKLHLKEIWMEKLFLDRFQEDVDKFMTEKRAEGWK